LKEESGHISSPDSRERKSLSQTSNSRNPSLFFKQIFSMTATSEKPGVPPSAATDAVLVPSNEMPKGSKKVEGIDFNKLAGGAITIDDLMSGMMNMGFQASSIGEAVQIINDMVIPLPSTPFSQVLTSTESLA
jgi:hypothetical protein